jgi:hypothetical protein
MRTLKPIPGCLAIAFLLVSCQAPTAALTPTMAPQSNPQTSTAILQATPTTEKSITAAKAAPTPTQVVATATPTVYYTPTITPTSTPDTRPLPNTWRQWPIVPTLSAKAMEVYKKGVATGLDPHSFSRIGDCQSEPEVFMGIYDTPDRYYLDRQHQYLQATIEQFSRAFSRVDMTARRGFGIASIFSPLMADPKACNANETPLACEFRIHKPIMVVISMGTNWCVGCTRSFDEYLRKIVDYSIQNGVIPILSTKADNIEGDNSLNADVAKVAYDYDMPLWNFWAAVQYLPNHGLMEDNIYLTVEGWNERSFTGLMTLDAIWTKVKTNTP